MELSLNPRLKHENPELSYKFGFLGIGMGGTSIAAACADIETDVKNNRYPYTAVLINSNQLDLDKVVKQKRNSNTIEVLIGDGKGAGRNINVGEALYKKEVEKIDEVIKSHFRTSDYVWLVVGLGGGTGTGSVIQAIGSLMKNGFSKRFGLILTLPRDSEGSTVNNNALQRLKQIYGAMNNLGPIIIVDNKKLFKEFSQNNPNATIEGYLKFSNNFVAEAIHDLNTVTASYVPVGDNHFDSSEFGIMLRTPGLLHFARFGAKSSTIDVSQPVSYINKLKANIENGVLSDGFDLATAKRGALSVLSNKGRDQQRLYTIEFTDQLEGLMSSLVATASEKPVAMYTYNSQNDNNVYFYAVFAGLGLPEGRIAEMIAADQEANEAKKLSEATANKNLFADFTGSSFNQSNSEEKSFEDLFGDSGSNNDEDKEEVSEEDLIKTLGL